MQPLTFPCPRCDRRMGVGIESAGRAVRCPYCQEVVTAPSLAAPPPAEPPPPPALKDLFANVNNREGADSILADPEDSDDSVFSAFEMKKPPVLPLPGPVGPVLLHSPSPVAVVPKPADPFGNLAVDPPAEAKPKAAKEPIRPKKPFAIDWKILAIIGLTGYAILMTGLAAWGWMREGKTAPSEPPAKKAK